jgi:hypothetical protein
MRIAIAALVSVIGSQAFASPQCTTEPSSKWIAAEAIKVKVAAMGHRINVFKTTKGNCYEVYGKDSAGKNIEIYFNPINGNVVEEIK